MADIHHTATDIFVHLYMSSFNINMNHTAVTVYLAASTRSVLVTSMVLEVSVYDVANWELSGVMVFSHTGYFDHI